MEQALIEAFGELVLGRWSDYAVQKDDGRYARVGHPLTWRSVEGHLIGKFTLGSYVLDEQGRCGYAVFDADQQDGLAVLAEIARQLAGEGIPSVLEASRRGGHLWVFLDAWMPGWWVRQQLLPFVPRGIEFFPKQEQLGGGYGSLVRVPLGIHRVTGKRYPFVLWEGGIASSVADTLGGQIRWLLSQGRWGVRHLAQRVPRVAPARHAPAASITSSTGMVPPSPFASIAAWCAAKNPFAIIGRYVALDRQGLGCCPFGEHHSDGKDTHPSLRVYMPKRPGGACWHCYTWGRGGNVFNFLQQYHRLDAHTLWARIRAGERF